MPTLDSVCTQFAAVDGRTPYSIYWTARMLRAANLIRESEAKGAPRIELNADDGAALLIGLYGGSAPIEAGAHAARMLVLPRSVPTVVGEADQAAPEGMAGLAVAATFGDALAWLVGRLPWVLLRAASVERNAGADEARIEGLLATGEAGYSVVQVEFGASGWANIMVQDRRGLVLARGYADGGAEAPATARKASKLIGPRHLIAMWRSIAGDTKADAALDAVRRRIGLAVPDALEVA